MEQDFVLIQAALAWLSKEGIISASQFMKVRVPLKIGKIKPGVTWSVIFAIVTGALAFIVSGGQWEPSAAADIGARSVGYWLYAYGIYESSNAKAREAKAHALKAKDALVEIVGDAEEAINEAWAEQDEPAG